MKHQQDRMANWGLGERLSSRPGRAALRDGLPEVVARHQRAAGDGRKATHGTIDVDPFPVELHGQQRGGAWYGHDRRKMYYPLVAGFRAASGISDEFAGVDFVAREGARSVAYPLWYVSDLPAAGRRSTPSGGLHGYSAARSAGEAGWRRFKDAAVS